jgi:hypothetical protein
LRCSETRPNTLRSQNRYTREQHVRPRHA